MAHLSVQRKSIDARITKEDDMTAILVSITEVQDYDFE